MAEKSSEVLPRVLLWGESGLGKSTLVNAIFCRKVAEASAGTPVTQGYQSFSPLQVPMILEDSEGLEPDTARQRMQQLAAKAKEPFESPSRVHIVWYFVGRRWFPADKRTVDELLSANVPVCLVINKCDERGAEELEALRGAINEAFAGAAPPAVYFISAKPVPYGPAKCRKGHDEVVVKRQDPGTWVCTECSEKGQTSTEPVDVLKLLVGTMHLLPKVLQSKFSTAVRLCGWELPKSFLNTALTATAKFGCPAITVASLLGRHEIVACASALVFGWCCYTDKQTGHQINQRQLMCQSVETKPMVFATPDMLEWFPRDVLDSPVRDLVSVLTDLEADVPGILTQGQRALAEYGDANQAAIHLITLPSPKLHNTINRRLFTADRRSQYTVGPFLPFLRLLVTALRHSAPKYTGTVFRSVFEDGKEFSRASVEKFVEGHCCHFWSFSHCSKEQAVADHPSFMGTAESRVRTLFHIECREGYDVEQFSLIPKEREVILLPVSQFLVKRCYYSESKKERTVHLAQLPDTVWCDL